MLSLLYNAGTVSLRVAEKKKGGGEKGEKKVKHKKVSTCSGYSGIVCVWKSTLHGTTHIKFGLTSGKGEANG